jgi:hypothetical protein
MALIAMRMLAISPCHGILSLAQFLVLMGYLPKIYTIAPNTMKAFTI